VKKLLVSLSIAALAISCGGDKGDQVLAKVNGEKIKLSDLEKKYDSLKKQLFDLKDQEYKYKRHFLDEVIQEKLIEAEAKAQKVTAEELLSKEVAKRIRPVTEEEITKFIAEKGIPKDQAAQLKERIQRYLESQQQNDIKASVAAELKAKYSVSISLDKPKKDKVQVAVTDTDPTFGAKDSKVTVVMFSDFECPYCQRGADTLKKAKAEYADKVKFVFKQFPLSFHQNAQGAAEASLCVNEQGKFWEYHDVLFTNQKALAKADLAKAAQALGVDMAKFNECLNSGKMKARVAADQEAGSKVGISGTPAFVINGQLEVGAIDYAQLKSVIEDAMTE